MKFAKVHLRHAVLVLAGLLSLPLTAGELADTSWRISLSGGRLGPVETTVTIEQRGDILYASSNSGALQFIRDLPGAKNPAINLGEALLSFTLSESDDGYSGEMVSPWPGSEINLRVNPDGITGQISGGFFGGSLSGQRIEKTGSMAPLRDYPAIIKQLQDVVARKIYNPRDLENEAYLLFSDRMARLAQLANDDLDLLLGFKFAWTSAAFSHFQFTRSEHSAEQMMQQFDHYRIGKRLAYVEFDDDIAVLSVHTMMGADTIEFIDSAYEEIAQSQARALIIDLRNNTGGAFAVKPLVEHIIRQPLEAGYFVSQKWHASNDQLPGQADIDSIAPWQGWSLIEFWNSVQQDGLMKIRFQPDTPGFTGPVYVLTSNKTASAAEMATDALRASGLVTLVGEKTAGEMLSQSFFDVGDGFLVSLPVADYFSMTNGRIEGAGISPDVETPSADALETAKRLARAAIIEG